MNNITRGAKNSEHAQLDIPNNTYMPLQPIYIICVYIYASCGPHAFSPMFFTEKVMHSLLVACEFGAFHF